MRQLEDVQYARGLDGARVGEWTPEFIQLLKTRFESTKADLSDETKFGRNGDNYTPIIVPTNETRHAINRKIIRANLEKNPTETVWRINASVTTSARGRKPNAAQLREIRTLPDNRTKRLPAQLDIFIGMRVAIQSNIATELGVATSTSGFVYDVIFPEKTTFEHVPYTKDDCHFVSVPSLMPKCILVQVDGARHPRIEGLCDDVPDDVFPVLMSEQRVQIRLPSNGRIRSFSITLKQFPVVPSYALTVHRVQGMTLKSVIIGSFFEGRPQPSSAVYVMLSRVKSASGLFLLQDFSQLFSEVPRRIPLCISPKVSNELSRLRNLAVCTRKRLSEFIECGSD